MQVGDTYWHPDGIGWELIIYISPVGNQYNFLMLTPNARIRTGRDYNRLFYVEQGWIKLE